MALSACKGTYFARVLMLPSSLDRMLVVLLNGVCRFQRSVLKKGSILKQGKAGTLFGDRYAVSGYIVSVAAYRI